jgi:hypothetical protein
MRSLFTRAMTQCIHLAQLDLQVTYSRNYVLSNNIFATKYKFKFYRFLFILLIKILIVSIDHLFVYKEIALSLAQGCITASLTPPIFLKKYARIPLSTSARPPLLVHIFLMCECSSRFLTHVRGAYLSLLRADNLVWQLHCRHVGHGRQLH